LKRLSPWAVIFILTLCIPGHSARFPNSVPKTFTVQGEAALEWLKLLGLNPDQPQTIAWPLNPAELHAFSLRTPAPTEIAPRSNPLTYDPKRQSLSFSGDWLDETTGSGKGLPRFAFGSGFISENLEGPPAWVALLKALGFPKKNLSQQNGEILLQKSSEGGRFPRLQVRVYNYQSWEKNPEGSWGYEVLIGIDEE